MATKVLYRTIIDYCDVAISRNSLITLIVNDCNIPVHVATFAVCDLINCYRIREINGKCVSC
jgi:hypothetical protein